MSGNFQATVRFPNGLMWLMSEESKRIEVPDVDGVSNFWTSHNAWGVAVLHDADGEVQVSVGSDPLEDPALALLHEGVLHSSGRQFDVETVYIDRVASFHTKSDEATISIWVTTQGSRSASTSNARTSRRCCDRRAAPALQQSHRRRAGPA